MRARVARLVAITVASIGVLSAGETTTHAATVTVDTSRTIARLAPESIGLSYEMRTVGEGGFDAAVGNEATILATLGIHNIRIGGNTVNYGTFWQTGGQPVPTWASIIVTPADAERVATFARTIDARIAWAVNLEHLDPPLIDNQVATVVAAFGANLHSIQCGNEPNLLFTGYAAFKTSFDGCRDAVGGKAKISGPDAVAGGSAWHTQFVAEELSALNELNFHYYTEQRTVTTLLAPANITRAISAIGPWVALARANGLSYRTDESNAQSSGGVPGVADVYASALWAMDHSLATAQAGAGINFHGFMGVCGQPTINGRFSYYTPICAASVADEAAKVMTAAPEYYGLWMANHLGPGQFHPLTITEATNLSAYAVRGDDGLIRVALIEKNAPGGQLAVSLNLGSGIASGTAGVIHLTGPSLTSASDVMIQGATVDRDGRLAPGAPDRVPHSGGMLSLNMPTGTAALITLGTPSAPGTGGAPGDAGSAGSGGSAGAPAVDGSSNTGDRGGNGGTAGQGGSAGQGGATGGTGGTGGSGASGGASGARPRPKASSGGCAVAGYPSTKPLIVLLVGAFLGLRRRRPPRRSARPEVSSQRR